MTDQEFESNGRKIIAALIAMKDEDFHQLALAVEANLASVRKCCSDGHVLALTPTTYCDTQCANRGADEASEVFRRLRDLRRAEATLREARAASAVLKRII